MSEVSNTNSRRITQPWLLLALGVMIGSSAQGQAWNQFRGPDGSGIAPRASVVPLEWKEGSDNIRWKIPIRGRGWSSPVVWGNQLWVTTATDKGKQMFALCFDRKTGEQIHDLLVFENEETRPAHATNSYASCTPFIEDGRIYVHFGSYGTACIDTKTGKKIWERRDLPCNHWRGPGSSPIVHGENLIVAYDGYDLQYVVCLNKNTGKTIWKRDRNIDYGTDNGDRKKAYSTAKVIKHAGRTQVISPSAVETISYDLDTGREFWRVRHGGMNAAAIPAYDKGLLYIQAGSGKTSLIAIRPDGSGDLKDDHIAWNLGKGVPRRPSPLLHEGRLFLMKDDGIASCVDAETGKSIWTSRIGGSYRASPILVNGYLYFPSLEGEIYVIKADGKKPETILKNRLADGCQATPAVADNALYIRTITHLYCIQD